MHEYLNIVTRQCKGKRYPNFDIYTVEQPRSQMSGQNIWIKMILISSWIAESSELQIGRETLIWDNLILNQSDFKSML